MERTKTRWTVIASNIVCYIPCTTKVVPYIIPYQGSSLPRQLFFDLSLYTRFAMTFCIRSNMNFSFVFSALAHLGLFLYYFLTK